MTLTCIWLLISACKASERPPEYALSTPMLWAENQVFRDSVVIHAEFRLDESILRYTLDGSDPDPGSPELRGSLSLHQEGELRIRAFHPEFQAGEVASIQVYKSGIEPTGLRLSDMPSAPYDGTPELLMDARLGSLDFRDGKWLGFRGSDPEIVLDLGVERTVNEIKLHFLDDRASYIFPPSSLILSFSLDGVVWSEPDSTTFEMPTTIEVAQVSVAAASCNEIVRLIKLTIVSGGALPSWHPGAGEPSWLFIDEVLVR